MRTAIGLIIIALPFWFAVGLAGGLGPALHKLASALGVL